MGSRTEKRFCRLSDASDKAIAKDFASDLSPGQAKLLAATQRPWFAGCLDDKVSHVAWHDKASWMVGTGNDRKRELSSLHRSSDHTRSRDLSAAPPTLQSYL